MNTQPRPMSDLVLALTGPIVWAAHFFFLYLAEAFLCSGQIPATGMAVRATGAAATVVALTALVLFALRSRTAGRSGSGSAQTGTALGFAVPLALLSMVAVLWSSVPLLLLPACAPAPS